MSASPSPEALHVIGHNLELRGIKTFLIRCAPDLYIVEAGYQSPPAATPVTLHYASNDIEQLDHEEQERNDRVPAVKDFLSLSETLWAVGTYVMGKGARLLSVSNNASTEKRPAVNIEYQTVEGDRVIEDLTASAIYELCVRLYKLREKSSTKNIRYTRFSALQEKNS